MKLIMKTIFGSHLYGTASKKSDTDIKGVYLPTLDDLILQKTGKSINNITKKDVNKKNTKDDVDSEIYSLHYFLQLAFKGETVSLDMLHIPKRLLLESTPEWDFIYQNRNKFYTKNLKAYLGYCRTQAAKYGVKGSRLADAEKVINYLKTIDNPYLKLSEIWDNIPMGENIKFIEIDNAQQKDKRALEVCSRKIMADTRVIYAIEVVQKFYDSYGERARLAKENKNIDWKSISHAFRAGLQLKEIYETGDLIFPLKEKDFLKKIKQGEFHYQDDGISQMLEDLIDEVEQLSINSNYPEKVDQDFWNDWLIGLYNKKPNKNILARQLEKQWQIVTTNMSINNFEHMAKYIVKEYF